MNCPAGVGWMVTAGGNQTSHTGAREVLVSLVGWLGGKRPIILLGHEVVLIGLGALLAVLVRVESGYCSYIPVCFALRISPR